MFPNGAPDRDRLVRDFAARVIARLDHRRKSPEAWIAERTASAHAMTEAANWAKRAEEWERQFAVLHAR